MKRKIIISIVILLVSFSKLEAQNYIIVGEITGHIVNEYNKPSYTYSITKTNRATRSFNKISNSLKETVILTPLQNSIHEITITDKKGKLMWKRVKNNQEEEKSLAALNNGFYMLILIINDKIVTSKVIRKHSNYFSTRY
jgi:hypothetical protein